jgi:hypothetical protein
MLFVALMSVTDSNSLKIESVEATNAGSVGLTILLFLCAVYSWVLLPDLYRIYQSCRHVTRRSRPVSRNQ